MSIVSDPVRCSKFVPESNARLSHAYAGVPSVGELHQSHTHWLCVYCDHDKSVHFGIRFALTTLPRRLSQWTQLKLLLSAAYIQCTYGYVCIFPLPLNLNWSTTLTLFYRLSISLPLVRYYLGMDRIYMYAAAGWYIVCHHRKSEYKSENGSNRRSYIERHNNGCYLCYIRNKCSDIRFWHWILIAAIASIGSASKGTLKIQNLLNLIFNYHTKVHMYLHTH